MHRAGPRDPASSQRLQACLPDSQAGPARLHLNKQLLLCPGAALCRQRLAGRLLCFPATRLLLDVARGRRDGISSSAAARSTASAHRNRIRVSSCGDRTPAAVVGWGRLGVARRGPVARERGGGRGAGRGRIRQAARCAQARQPRLRVLPRACVAYSCALASCTVL